MNDMTVLGEILYEHRIALGLTQQELADYADIQRTYISDIERGRRNVTVFVLTRIAVALGITLVQLFRMAEERVLEQALKKRRRRK
jgi:transcriptional regulator with XRE-family HTH domain